MRTKVGMRGEPSGRRREGVSPAPDRLSDLPDALLHHIMSFMKAWEVVRTCVLSWRWSNLWASAPCVDVRLGRYTHLPGGLTKFVYRLLLARDALAPLDTLRLRSPGNDNFDMEDVKMWIHHAVQRNARVIQLNGHRNSYVELYRIGFVSRHLKVLKLSYVMLVYPSCIMRSNGMLVYDKLDQRHLLSGCPCLEELELKDCLVDVDEITSASLKSLIMVKCDFIPGFTVDCPNLVVVRCVAPQRWVPLFKNLGSLVTGSVMLDDSLLRFYLCKHHEDYEFAQTGDEDSEDDSVDTSDDSDESSYDSGHSSDDIEDNYDYGSDINSDTDTYEYSEIANASEDWQFGNCDDGHGSSKCSNYHDCSATYAITENKRSGGQSVLHSLSNAQCLELLGHSGEVVLRKEAISCPTFSNLKTLVLGEWCISTGADFGILTILLQHSPNLGKLILQLEMDSDIQKASGTGIKPKGGSFACKHLRMVKIRCTKDDPRVHMLVWLFRSNGVPLEKIYVRRSGSFYLRNMKYERKTGFTICEPY